MRNQLIATAAAAALLALAGSAQAQVVGHVGLNYGHVDLDLGGLSADADAPQLEGAVRFDAGSLGAQIDGAVTNYSGDGDDQTLWSATGHLNAKVGDGLVGGFAGVSTADDVTLWAAGLEGQINLAPAVSLYGQAGYGQADDLNDVDFWAARAELRYFVSDNFKVQGLAGYTAAKASGPDLDMWNVGAGAEYQFAGTPWSVTGAYEHAELNDIDFNTDTFRVGVRYTFGGTLHDQDRSGASLGSAANLFGGELGQVLIAALGGL